MKKHTTLIAGLTFAMLAPVACLAQAQGPSVFQDEFFNVRKPGIAADLLVWGGL